MSIMRALYLAATVIAGLPSGRAKKIGLFYNLSDFSCLRILKRLTRWGLCNDGFSVITRYKMCVVIFLASSRVFCPTRVLRVQTILLKAMKLVLPCKVAVLLCFCARSEG